MNFKTACIISVVLGIAMNTYAVPADPRPRTFVQPDGTELTYYLRGDESHHIYVSDDGYLLQNRANTMYYADVDAAGNIVASELIARPKDMRTNIDNRYLDQVDMSVVFERLTRQARQAVPRVAGRRTLSTYSDMPHTPGLFDDSFPCQGKPNVMVVLVEYTDVKFKLSDPYDYFERLLNEQGFADYGGTGSAHDYFLDNSNGTFDPTFDLFGPVTLNNKMSYYGANDSNGSDKRAHEMIIEACQKLDDTVDFSKYDCDGDGYIDNVFVYYAGQGEASYGPTNSVWPHSWNITYATNTPYMFDGVQLDRYACSNEWESNRPDGIGTFVHEFSHVMGLPDLYATSYTDAFTPGAWSVMDVGSYNNDGMTPPNYSAFERAALGWLQPKVMDSPCAVSLPDITSNEAYYIPTEKANEYFLIENRQKKGWDKYIPGHGMLVWHIDYKESVWYSNEVNNTSSHQRVDLVEADNKKNESTRSGDSFPGTGKVTSFTNETKPAMKSWAGKAVGLPITEITENNGIIEFLVDGGVEIELSQVVAHPATDITPVSMTISWDSDPAATSYVVCIYTRDSEGAPQYVDGWDHKNVGNKLSVYIDRLMPETTYYYTICSAYNSLLGEESKELSATTADTPLYMRKAVATEATNVEPASFQANWEPVAGADRYYINLFTKDTVTEETRSCGFSMDPNPIPEGWESNTIQTYASASFCGDDVPSLRLSADGDYICSPVLGAGICYVSFWHRGSLNTADNCIIVSALLNNKYSEIARYQIYQSPKGQVIEIDDIPQHATRIKIEMSRKADKGSIAIDDIVVRGVSGDLRMPVPEYDKYEVGDNTSALIEGLTPNTEYYYTVIASDGTDESIESDEVKVVTMDRTSVVDAINMTKIRVNGLLVTATAPADTHISIYDTMGCLISVANVPKAGTLTLAVPTHGIYILRIDNTIRKISI